MLERTCAVSSRPSVLAGALRRPFWRGLGGAGLALCLLLLAPAARGQNLLANPDFETSAGGGQPTGWSNVSSSTSAVLNWGWPDNALAPGSMIFRNTYPDAGTGVLIYQCVPVSPGTRYLASLHALFQSGQTRTGTIRLDVGSTSNANCVGPFTLLGQAHILSSGASDVWLQDSVRVVTPAGAASVQVSLSATKNEAGGELDVLADAVYFGRPVKGDFNDDGYADLVLDNLSSDVHRVWTMGGTVREASRLVTPDVPSADWKLAVTDDFNDDGRTDMVFRHQAGGSMMFWMMNGVDRYDGAALGGAAPPPPTWTLAAAADFNHDHKPDLLWRDETTQQLSIWTMNGADYTGTITPSPAQAVDGNWAVVVASDLDRDGNTDLLWYNSTSGKIVRWLMDANVERITGGFTTPSSAGNNNWKVVSAGEYKRLPDASATDGVDIVWRNETSGKLVEWLMDASGTRVHGAFTAPDSPNPPLAWTVVGPR